MTYTILHLAFHIFHVVTKCTDEVLFYTSVRKIGLHLREDKTESLSFYRIYDILRI